MKFSIITINYNNRDGLKHTIDSVANQSCRDFEYIIIDGGSSDGSVEVIKNAGSDANISFWCSEKDDGIYNAMNKGVDKATGDYCIFLNSGDCFCDKDVLKDVMQDGLKADIVSGDIIFDTGLHCLSHDSVSLAHFYEHSLYHQATFIRTSLLKENKYDETLKIASDWKFFLEEIVLKNRSYQHIHRDIAVFESGGLSADNKDLIRNEQMSVLRHYFPESVLHDYEIFTHGADDYDGFFMTLKHSRLKSLIFNIDKFLVKTFWLFKH